jgi:quercetin dioxygenase-like cupin family protein
LSDVAKAASVSPSLLSQIERGLVGPSLDSLRDIAEALGTEPFRLLLGDVGPSHAVVRAGEGTLLPLPEFSEFRLLSPSLHGSFEVGTWTLAPGEANSRGARAHGGEEANLIISGSARVQIGVEVIDLDEGDFITFDGHLPHRVVATGAAPTSALFVVSPPSF